MTTTSLETGKNMFSFDLNALRTAYIQPNKAKNRKQTMLNEWLVALMVIMMTCCRYLGLQVGYKTLGISLLAFIGWKMHRTREYSLENKPEGLLWCLNPAQPIAAHFWEASQWVEPLDISCQKPLLLTPGWKCDEFSLDISQVVQKASWVFISNDM